jgi:hypothetical protein
MNLPGFRLHSLKLGLQMAYDLWQARERVRSIRVRHFKAA